MTNRYRNFTQLGLKDVVAVGNPRCRICVDVIERVENGNGAYRDTLYFAQQRGELEVVGEFRRRAIGIPRIDNQIDALVLFTSVVRSKQRC